MSSQVRFCATLLAISAAHPFDGFNDGFRWIWLQGRDLNPRPPAYEAGELPVCSTLLNRAAVCPVNRPAIWLRADLTAIAALQSGAVGYIHRSSTLLDDRREITFAQSRRHVKRHSGISLK